MLDLFGGEALRFAEGPPLRLALQAFAFGAFALVSASSGAMVLMDGLNAAYRTGETRSWIKRRLVSLLIVGFAVTDIAADLVPANGLSFGVTFGEPWSALAKVLLHSTILFLLSAVTFSLMYRYGPDRRTVRWRWATPGGVLASLIGLATAAAMSFYLTSLARYDQTYGAAGAMMALGVWLWSGIIVLLGGAELNDAIEAEEEDGILERSRSTTGALHESA